jgi:hypothetical protein
MGSGIAKRRGDKAARRKKLLAERRRVAVATTGSPLAETTRRLASAPLHACLIQDGTLERGIGSIVLIRKPAAGMLAMAWFLIDSYCLGVKDVLFRQGDAEEIEMLVDFLSDAAPLLPVDTAYARKLVRQLVSWARGLGFQPQKDYAAAELLFGNVSVEACDAEFAFGLDGKPTYVPGPGETPAKIRRDIATLRRSVGDGGFEFIVGVGDDEGEDDANYDADDALDNAEFVMDEASDYDPNVAPDPEAWLALDDHKRLVWARTYHRRAGIDVGPESLHATVHVIVENQIAEGPDHPVSRAIVRLMGEGMDRHEAIHAVGTLLAEFVMAATQSGSEPRKPDWWNAAEQITAESWRRYCEQAEAEFGADTDPGQRTLGFDIREP